jgi:syntaxin 6
LSLTLSLSLSYLQDTAVNTHALKDAKKQLKRHIRNAESTLKDVQTTISLVETQKDRFAHIDASELYERKALVTTSNDRLGRVKSDMNSDVIKQKILADERAKAQRRMKRDDDEEHDIENTAFIADSQAHTSLLLQQQDETLDELGEAVTRVGQMAENIHQEIGYQNKMLTDMEDDLADAEEKLGLVMGKLAKFLKTKDKWQLENHPHVDFGSAYSFLFGFDHLSSTHSFLPTYIYQSESERPTHATVSSYHLLRAIVYRISMHAVQEKKPVCCCMFVFGICVTNQVLEGQRIHLYGTK